MKSKKRTGGGRAAGKRPARSRGSLASARAGERRSASIERRTRETAVEASVRLDGPPAADVETPIPFLTHMLEAFACHGCFSIRVRASGDVHVDPHHLIEDCGIVLGSAFARALDSSPPVSRAGCFSFPMDGSLASAAVDLCGRPNLFWDADLGAEAIGGAPPGLFRDFWKGFADGLRATIHLSVIRKDNDHHAVEAVFKAAARSLKMAVAPSGFDAPSSSKGVLDD